MRSNCCALAGGCHRCWSTRAWTTSSWPTSTVQPESLEAACREAGQPLTLRRHAGYDHGYFFVSTFIGDHLHHHLARLFVAAWHPKRGLA